MRKRKGPVASSEVASRRMARVRQRDTEAEMKIRRRLHGMGFRYRVDFPVLERPRRRADIVFTRLRVAVFVDGCFWHGCPEHGTSSKSNVEFWHDKIDTNRARDLDTNQRLIAKGWEVIRVWEHEEPDEAATRIAKVIRSRAKRIE